MTETFAYVYGSEPGDSGACNFCFDNGNVGEMDRFVVSCRS